MPGHTPGPSPFAVSGSTTKSAYMALYQILQTVVLPAGIGGKLISPGVYGWQRTSRRTIDWENVASADMPFMLLHAGVIEEEQKSALALPIYTMHANCWVFMRMDPTPDDTTTADDLVHDVYDAIDNALLGPAAGELQTLGGTVYHAYPAGCVFEAAIEDNQVLMFVPIIMKTGV